MRFPDIIVMAMAAVLATISTAAHAEVYCLVQVEEASNGGHALGRATQARAMEYLREWECTPLDAVAFEKSGEPRVAAILSISLSSRSIPAFGGSDLSPQMVTLTTILRDPDSGAAAWSSTYTRNQPHIDPVAGGAQAVNSALAAAFRDMAAPAQALLQSFDPTPPAVATSGGGSSAESAGSTEDQRRQEREAAIRERMRQRSTSQD